MPSLYRQPTILASLSIFHRVSPFNGKSLPLNCQLISNEILGGAVISASNAEKNLLNTQFMPFLAMFCRLYRCLTLPCSPLKTRVLAKNRSITLRNSRYISISIQKHKISW
jgi:hypothetical protein